MKPNYKGSYGTYNCRKPSQIKVKSSDNKARKFEKPQKKENTQYEDGMTCKHWWCAKLFKIELYRPMFMCVLLCSSYGDEWSPEKPRDSGEKKVLCVQNIWIQANTRV